MAAGPADAPAGRAAGADRPDGRRRCGQQPHRRRARGQPLDGHPVARALRRGRPGRAHRDGARSRPQAGHRRRAHPGHRGGHDLTPRRRARPTGAAARWPRRRASARPPCSASGTRTAWRRTGRAAFKLSRDPRFSEKLTDVVGLYLDPPDQAIVLCVDEKSQIQALDRTQPALPMKPGRAGTYHPRLQAQRHDHAVRGARHARRAGHRPVPCRVTGTRSSSTFLRRLDRSTPPELDLHLIVDNYGTHKHPRRRAWLAKHPRFVLHFTPTSSSWLNLVERWFRELTEQAHPARRLPQRARN